MSLTLFAGGAIGTTLSGGGLFALRKAWKTKSAGLSLILMGWAAICLGIIAWSLAGGGGDRGAAWGIIIASLQALLFVCYSASKDKQPRKPAKPVKTRADASPATLTPFLIFKRIGTFLMASLLCGLIAFLTAMGLHEIMGFLGAHASNSLVLALFFFPIIWAALASFALITENRRRRWAVLSGLALFGAVMLLLGNGGLG